MASAFSFRFAFLGLALALSLLGQSACADNSAKAQIPESALNIFDFQTPTKKLLPFLDVEKTYVNTYDGNTHYDINFTTNVDELPGQNDTKNKVAVYDNTLEHQIVIEATADCNTKNAKVIYGTSINDVYLATSTRANGTIPQSAPAKQILQFFRLAQNSSHSPGFTPLYFSKVGEKTTSQLYCDEDQISMMLFSEFTDNEF